ncbi:hypothetical protein PS925_03505 [Pseudomonas fluorescens]|uniref:Uncharacterized protein n=1 Tax=Pseudomonas fluorescens TaxID=294 RepID=A0A5E7UM02_PSEFL|nr:hypothetical protein PS925_03505 [Pseudomonas fluorescens]
MPEEKVVMYESPDAASIQNARGRRWCRPT